MKLCPVNRDGRHIAPVPSSDLPMNLRGNLSLGGDAVNMFGLAAVVIGVIMTVHRVLRHAHELSGRRVVEERSKNDPDVAVVQSTGYLF